MNHGGIGLIEHFKATKGLRLLFPRDILRTLGIEDGSILDGIFYSGRPETNTQPTIDFVFSPIPFRLWPKVGRMRVRLLNKPGSVAEFSAFLASNKVSILHSEFTRSGYRFATWNFVVAFDIAVSDKDFNPSTTAFDATIEKLHSVRKEINEHCSHLLFKLKDDIRFRESIDIWPLAALAYFYNYSRRACESKEDTWMYEPFSITCSSGEFVCPPGNHFPAILGKLLPREEGARTCIYTDVSSTDVILRAALIPTKDENRFMEVTVEYARLAPPDTSRGFCAHITKMLPDHMKVWKLTNYTKVNRDFTEVGGAKFLIEDTQSKAGGPGGLSNSARDLLARIRESEFRVERNQTFDVEAGAKPLSVTDVWRALALDRAHDSRNVVDYDIFLSYSAKDAEIAEILQGQLEDSNLRCFMAKRDLQGHEGDDFAERIRQAILKSRELLLLCSPSSTKSEWVTTEWAAAWILGKRITPVLHQMPVDALPLRLKIRHYAEALKFGSFIEGAVRRKEEWNSIS